MTVLFPAPEWPVITHSMNPNLCHDAKASAAGGPPEARLLMEQAAVSTIIQK